MNCAHLESRVCDDCAPSRDETIARLTRERDEAIEKRDRWKFAWEIATSGKLDGYRALGAKAAAAENERDEWKARAEAAEAKLDALLVPARLDEADFAGDPVVAWRAYHAEKDRAEAAERRVAELQAEAVHAQECRAALCDDETRLEAENARLRDEVQRLEALIVKRYEAKSIGDQGEFDYRAYKEGEAIAERRAARPEAGAREGK